MCFAASKTAITMTIMNECPILRVMMFFPAKQANPANQKYTYDLAVSSLAAKKLDQSVLSSSI